MTEKKGKLIIFTAPSGAGKTTIVRHLLEKFDSLAFSVSATNRPKRKHEQNGRDYYFLSTDRFKELVENGSFAEWEEVYPGQYYGTLRTEIERLWKQGKHIIFDIDVRGAKNLKEIYGDKALAIFVKPPSKEELFRRLRSRRTENEQSLRRRMQRAEEELKWEDRFDAVLVNDYLPKAFAEAEKMVGNFIGESPQEKKSDKKERP